MAQISLYLEDDVFEQLKAAAQNERVSISAWVRGRLEPALARAHGQWPAGYFEAVLGSLADDELAPPADVPFDRDAIPDLDAP